MDNAQRLQLVFQTLGDANRIRIIQFIGERECTVSEIVQAFSLSQPLVSHHLRVLRENQVLDSMRKGPFVIYKLKDTKLLEALNLFLMIFQNYNGADKNEDMSSGNPHWRC